MFVHIWRMRGKKKKGAAYEKFGLQVTLPTLRKIDGCLDAHFIKVSGARKPEYLWLVFWQDKEALEAARTNPAWKEQIKKFEAGNFYKSIPLELVCELLGSSGGASVSKLKKVKKTKKAGKASENELAQEAEAEEQSEGSGHAFTPPTVDGE